MAVGVSAQRLLAGAFRLTLAKSMAGFTEQRMEIDANSTETILPSSAQPDSPADQDHAIVTSLKQDVKRRRNKVIMSLNSVV